MFIKKFGKFGSSIPLSSTKPPVISKYIRIDCEDADSIYDYPDEEDDMLYDCGDSDNNSGEVIDAGNSLSP